jgi:hypothetical protein
METSPCGPPCHLRMSGLLCPLLTGDCRDLRAHSPRHRVLDLV